MKTCTTKKLAGLLALALIGLTAAGNAQNPECRYWSGQAAQNWARGGYNASRGNIPQTGYYYGRAARDTGRAGYFCSPEWDRYRGPVTQSPSWDRSRNYFRR